MADDTAKPGEINGDALDRFTLLHFGAGAALGAVGAPWWAVVTVAIGWELLERPLKRKAPELFPHSSQDTVPNAVVEPIRDAGALIAKRKMARD